MKYSLLRTSLLLALLSLAQAAWAQFTAMGKVSDANGEPLIGVSVSVTGTSRGTLTDINGDYKVLVPSSAARLTFTYTGFKAVTISVTASSAKNDLVMEEDVARLDEVIVTGLATNIKRANAANAVSLVTGKDLTGTTVQQTVDGALYGKLTGATINANSGAPGGGISMKFRGVTTLTGNSQPLFIIDGVYIDNSALPNALNVVSGAYRDGRAISDQDNATNRLADLDPEDIERVEILKGASSAAIYGSRAGTGVVIITTKRGQSGGAPVVNVSQSLGVSSAIRLFGPREWDETKALTHFKQAGQDAYKAAKAAGKIYDYEDELYGNNGFLSTTRFNVSGGSENTKYFAGVTYKNETGIVPNTGYERLGVRLNLDQRLSKWFDLQLSSAYTRSEADRGYFNNDNTSTTNGVALSQTPVWAELHADANGNYPNNPYATANMLQTVEQMVNNENVNRIITGANVTTHLLERDNQSLRFIVRAGVDNYIFQSNISFPSTLQFQKDGNGTNGFVALGNTLNTNANINGFLLHSLSSGSMTFRTQAGMTAENFNQNTVLGTASFLIGSQTNLDQASGRNNIQRRIIQRDRGFFAQEEINWDDKVIVTVGIRGDKSTNNGDANKLYYYPRASAAVNLGALGGFATSGSDGLSLVKLRAAYGQSGNFPANGAIYTPLNSVVLGGNTGSIIGITRGNDELGPERQTEIEAGFDLGFMQDRVSVEFTFYNKSVADFLLRVGTPVSTGFSNSWANAGDISNKGIEIGVGIVPVRSRNLTWDNRFNFWLNRSEITKLNVPAFNEGGFAPFLGVFRIEEGKSATQIVGTIPADQDVNDGANDGLFAWGNSEPDFNLSWATSLNWKKLDFNMLWHWKQGGHGINLTTLLYDLSGTTWDYDDKTLDPTGALSNGDYRNALLGSSAEPYIENTGYMRLRELGVSYRIGTALWSKANLRVGVSGRNLLNFFSYNSYDPEVSNFGFRAISSNIEVTPFPSSKSVNLTISATF